MGGSTLQLVLTALATGALGIVAGLLLGALVNKRRIVQLSTAAKAQLQEAAIERDELAAELAQSQPTMESLKAAVAAGKVEVQTTRKKTKLLSQKVLALRAEREGTKIKVGTLQKSLLSVRDQTLALQKEFDKVGTFYKGELIKSLEKRKAVEQELHDVREEQETFARRMEQSVLEHGSPEEMIAAAQLRLGQLDVLERNVNKLEKENTELRNETNRVKREYESLERNLAEIDELKINNQQLVRAVEALENSRQQQEQEAEHFREQADQSEQLSETLRLKLNDLEQNFADIELQQQQALSKARKSTVVPTTDAANSALSGEDENQDVVDLAKYSNRG